MNKYNRILFATLLLLALNACASPPETHSLTPFPADIIDPDDEVLMRAVKDFLVTSDAPVSSRYEFSRQDLDSDGRRDALVLFKNPYGYWCGIHGCTILVMKANNDSFTLINAILPVRSPLYIGTTETNGWKDLIVRVSGRRKKTKNVVMRFDGKRYPIHPDGQAPYFRALSDGALRVFP